MWSETDEGRGTNQVGSCVAKHLFNLQSNIKLVVMYSDTCRGQNKSTHMIAMCMPVLKNQGNIEVLDYKFLVPGHTRMECDSDYAQVEKRKKKKWNADLSST